MKITKVKRSEIKINPKNPRIIKDHKFDKLIKSVEELPEMLEMRPIIVNEDMVILGGNMRYQACVRAGIVEIPIYKYTREEHEKSGQKKPYELVCDEIVIKDNSNFGEWDWDVLANEWNIDKLKHWGLNIPKWDDDSFDTAIEDTGLYDYPDDSTVSANVKMVQLFLNTETEPLLKKYELALREVYGTDNLTDTIFKAIENLYNESESK
jgi:hypothetical protein